MGNGQARQGTRRASALSLAILLAAGSAWAEEDACAPWPGEPMPLPKVTDPDGMRGRWAGLRVQELSSAAGDLEPGAPLRARELWQHVLCLYPGSTDAEAGLERTQVAAVHQPLIVTAGSTQTPVDGWTELSQELRVAVSRPQSAGPVDTPLPATAPTTATATAPSTADFDKALATLETQVKAAQFEAALESAALGREAAKNLGTSTNAKRAAQLEVLAATAALALGRGDDADSSFGRALASDPNLALDPVTTSPKVRRALERVRKGRTQ